MLGPDHPETLTTRGHLAHWLGEAGRVKEAISQFGALLNDRLRVLGPDHPDTLATRHSLARWLGEAGQVEEAISHLQAAHDDRLRVLGPDLVPLLLTECRLRHCEPCGQSTPLLER
jgi:hypothetical protein